MSTAIVSVPLTMPRIYFFVFVFKTNEIPKTASEKGLFADFKAELLRGLRSAPPNLTTGTIHMRDYAGRAFEVGVKNHFNSSPSDPVGEMPKPSSPYALVIFDLQTPDDCDPHQIQNVLQGVLGSVGWDKNLHYELCSVAIS